MHPGCTAKDAGAGVCGEGATSPAQKTVALSGVHGWAALPAPVHKPHCTQDPLALNLPTRIMKLRTCLRSHGHRGQRGHRVGRGLGVS